jgi:hypothetical protein
LSPASKVRISNNPKLSPLKQRIIGYSAILFILGCTAYIVSPTFLVRAHCPAGTFIASGMDSISWLILGVNLIIIFAAAALRRFGTVSRDTGTMLYGSPSRRETARWCAALGGISLLCAYLWLKVDSSYYCLTHENILLHPSLFQQKKVVDWADVKQIHTECGRSKSMVWGSLSLSLPGGIQISAPMDPGGYDYAVMLSLLKRNKSFQPSATTDPSRCWQAHGNG